MREISKCKVDFAYDDTSTYDAHDAICNVGNVIQAGDRDNDHNGVWKLGRYDNNFISIWCPTIEDQGLSCLKCLWRIT